MADNSTQRCIGFMRFHSKCLIKWFRSFQLFYRLLLPRYSFQLTYIIVYCIQLLLRSIGIGIRKAHIAINYDISANCSVKTGLISFSLIGTT